MPRHKMTDEEKAERKAKQAEQNRLDSLERELRNYRSHFALNPAPPVVKYEVGEPVRIGRLKNPVVKEVLDDGAIYKLDYINVDNNYGNPIETPAERYAAWHDLAKVRDEYPEQLSYRDELRVQFYNGHIRGLLLTYFTSGIDINPDYQRELVWTHSQKVALIESIYTNVEIGKFALIQRPYKENEKGYEILDGKQRLMALVEFYTSGFPYKGRFYNEMCSRDQDHFDNYSISIGDLEGNITERQKLLYFLKLNTGGTPVSKEHLDKIRDRLEEME